MTKAHQRIIRERIAEELNEPPRQVDFAQARVETVTYKFAKEIILKYEWLGSMSATRYHYGLFFGAMDSDCAGVVCVGGHNCVGGCQIPQMFGLAGHELGILARGACVHWSPHNANSYLIAAACRRLKQESPYRLLLAYADPSAGEIGTLYQACNWTYIGLSSKTYRLINPQTNHSFDMVNITVQAQKKASLGKNKRASLLSKAISRSTMRVSIVTRWCCISKTTRCGRW